MAHRPNADHKSILERKHIPELAYYDEYRKQLKDMITEPDKKINSKAWRTELASIDEIENYDTIKSMLRCT